MLDFWNDPDRWEGIDDPHTQFFWCGPRKPDVIDVRAVEAETIGESDAWALGVEYSNWSHFANGYITTSEKIDLRNSFGSASIRLLT